MKISEYNGAVIEHPQNWKADWLTVWNSEGDTPLFIISLTVEGHLKIESTRSDTLAIMPESRDSVEVFLVK